MDECLLLTRVPAEIRLKIYEYVLTFKRPLKLRQVVAGSKDTGILRASRLIYTEALPVFYDVNTIMVSRNDFCLETDSDLQTPLRRDKIRHLLVRNFSQSIRCSSFSGGNNMYLAGCCDVCKPDATSFIATVASLPRIRSVAVDYHHHYREFRFIKETIRGIGSTRADAEHGFKIDQVGMTKYKLSSPLLPSNLSFFFMDVALNTIWNELTVWGNMTASTESSTTNPDVPSEEELLARLRDEVDRDLADKVYLFWGARRLLKQTGPSITLGPVWRTFDDASGDCEERMEACAQGILHFCESHSVEEARATVRLFRESITTANDP